MSADEGMWNRAAQREQRAEIAKILDELRAINARLAALEAIVNTTLPPQPPNQSRL